MTGKFGFVAVAMLAATVASAADLAIVSGGKRIIDRDPASAASNCSQWTYGAAPLVDDGGNVVAMYTVSDQIANHCKAGLESPARFGDVIRRHELKADGTWSGGADVITRANLPWMTDAAFLATHPDSFIGHFASPSIARVGGRYFMAFVGSVNDPNLCAGEHPASGNICGSCVDPWSYFVAMWAVSDDGVNWRVRERTPGNPMLFGGAPVAKSLYKGITHVTLVPHDENGRTYFYIGAQYWGAQISKMLMMRVPFDPASDSGISADPELWSWNQGGWVSCPDGVIPDFINHADQQSLIGVYQPLSSIARTTIRGVPEYVALTVADGWMFGGNHAANRIGWQFSSNLVDWEFAKPMRSAVPYFADGNSYDASVIDPIVVDDRGALRLFLASADGDDAGGIPADGRHDCSLAGFGVTGPYVGTGIYEARIESITPAATQMTLTTDRTAFVDGETARVHIRVTDAQGRGVNGFVSVYGYSIARVQLVDGSGDADVVVRSITPATAINANFADQGLWRGSWAMAVVQIAPNHSRRRSVHH